MTRIAFELETNADEAFDNVAERCLDHPEGYALVADILEQAHERHFARLRGRYILTGETKASLTGTSPGSIRDIQGTSLKFGTRVRHARFLTKSPKDPEYGQVRKGNKGKGRSAVVVKPRGTDKKVAKAIAGFIAEPFGGDI